MQGPRSLFRRLRKQSQFQHQSPVVHQHRSKDSKTVQYVSKGLGPSLIHVAFTVMLYGEFPPRQWRVQSVDSGHHSLLSPDRLGLSAVTVL